MPHRLAPEAQRRRALADALAGRAEQDDACPLGQPLGRVEWTLTRRLSARSSSGDSWIGGALGASTVPSVEAGRACARVN
jgi:hypothetical protein